MARVVLVPNRTDPAWKDGVISRVFKPKDELPGYWKPELGDARQMEKVEAFAFPTPFAWAEMMAATIRQQQYDHYLFKLYDYLVRGLVLGHLQLKIVDLAEESGAFGQVLSNTDPDYRYFGLIQSNPANRELPQKIFGATSPESLFWPSPRCTPDDWRLLDEAINRDVNLSHTYLVLSDFRELLEKARLWDANSSVAPWMKGLEHIINEQRLTAQAKTGNIHFNVHSRQIGPVKVRFGDGTTRRLYFPVYQEKFAANFLRGLTGTFERENGTVAVYDRLKKKKYYEINSESKGAGGDSILAGMGTVTIVNEPGEELTSTEIRLKELFDSLQGLRKALGSDVEDIKKHPFFYPDVLRIAITRLGEAGYDTEVSFSDQAYKLTFDPNSLGLPLASDLTEITAETHGLVLNYTDENNRPRRAIYVESYAGSNIGDLRALGSVLWAFFTGEAQSVGGTLKVEDEDGDTISAFKESDSVRPFDLKGDIYRKVNNERDRHRRLARLQRFLKAYTPRSAASQGGVEKLLYEAASAFVKYVWADEAVIANGPVIENNRELLKSGGLNVMLAKDVMEI
jgi:hypothetical protein